MEESVKVVVVVYLDGHEGMLEESGGGRGKRGRVKEWK